MRVLTFIVVAFIMIGWLRVTWMTQTIAPMPLDGVGGVLIGALGVKAWQRGREGVKTTEPEKTPDIAIFKKT